MSSTSVSKDDDQTTLGIIGAGSLGSAMLIALLDASQNEQSGIPRRFIASVRSKASAEQLETQLKGKTLSSDSSVEIAIGNDDGLHNVAQRSNVVIIATPPGSIASILSSSGMRDALKGKLLISVAAGVTRTNMEKAIYGNDTPPQGDDRCWVIRTLPNLAARIGASTTAVEDSDPKPPENITKKVDSILKTFGTIVRVPAAQMDATTALCGSTPAYIALFCDALIDGAVASGVSRDNATAIATSVLAGTAALLKDGTRPSALREEVCAQPGCTIAGNMTLEQGGVRGVISKAMQDAIRVASQLG